MISQPQTGILSRSFGLARQNDYVGLACQNDYVGLACQNDYVGLAPLLRD